MAGGARAVGGATALFIALPFVAVVWRGGGAALAGPDLRIIGFTIEQAALSALLSVAFAIPVARALARRSFPGRGVLITMMGVPFLLPVIVAALGILMIFGRAGIVSDALAAFGLPRLSIYGLGGILIAHVFLNLPLATRMLLQGWQAIPPERLRLAESLSFAPADITRHLERPMLREVAPAALATIFAVCLTSFAVILMLSGGPWATTIELAIYQAVRFEFDLNHASGLALAQAALGAASAVIAWHLTRDADFGAAPGTSALLRPPGGWRLPADVVVLIAAAGFLLLPLGAIVLRGMAEIFSLPAVVWAAAGRSLWVALGAAALCMPVALVLALARARDERTHWLELVATLPLAISSLVLGTGLFVLVNHALPPARIALILTLALNALMALPFAFRLLLPDARRIEADYGRLASALDLGGMARLRLLTLPRLARPLGFSTGLAAAMSMGDLGVIALFADDRGATLPLMVQRLSAAYRTDAALGASLLLILLTVGIFAFFDAGGRHAAP